MLKGKVNKKTLSIIGTASLLCLSIAASISATVSWFSSSINVDTSIANISVISKDDTDYTVSYRVFKFDDQNKKGIENKSGNKYTFKLDSFDAFIENRNNYLCEIVELKIKSKADYPGGGKVTIDLGCSQNFLKTGVTAKVDSYISNLVKMDACLYSYKIKGLSTVNKFFEFGNVNRYKKSMDGTSVSYGGDTNDQLYQEVKYHLDNDTSRSIYSYISESDIQALPASTDPGFVDAMKAIDANKPENIKITVDSHKGSTAVIPNNFDEITLFLRFDYSSVLAHFFASNQNATIYEETGTGSAISVGNDIANIITGIIK